MSAAVKAKEKNFFEIEDDQDISDSDSNGEANEESNVVEEDHSEKDEDKNGITKEDAELVLDEYRSARTTGLPPPNVMFAASKKPEFLKASVVASKWDGEKELNNLRAERARKVANPDVISAAAKKTGDNWDANEGKSKRVKRS